MKETDRSRTAWEVQVFRAMCCYLQGDLIAAARMVDQLKAHLRSEPAADAPVGTAAPAASALSETQPERVAAARASQRLWTALLQALVLMHSADVTQAVPALEVARLLARQTVNDDTHWSELVQLQQMLLRTVNAYVLCRQGDRAAAVTEARNALQQLSFLAGNPLFAVSYVTLALCAEVLLAVSDAAAGATGEERARLLNLVVGSASARLDRFARCALACAWRNEHDGRFRPLIGTARLPAHRGLCSETIRSRCRARTWCAACTCASRASRLPAWPRCGSRVRARISSICRMPRHWYGSQITSAYERL